MAPKDEDEDRELTPEDLIAQQRREPVAGWDEFAEQHIERGWDELDLQPLVLPDALRDWVTLLGNEVAESEAAGWQANDEAYADLVAGHGRRLRHFTLLPDLLRSRELTAAMPDLASHRSLPETEFDFPENSFRLDGSMAESLWAGGAYTHHGWVSPGRAKELSSAAVHSLIEDRYADARLYTKREPDTWNALWILLDYGTSRIWVIWYWDTD